MADDIEFLRALETYDQPAANPNTETLGVEIVWERNNSSFGAMHIWNLHRVAEAEVEQVLFEVPPFVEARRHPRYPGRTVFWGATRHDRWLFVVCEDWHEGGRRYLRPITAF